MLLDSWKEGELKIGDDEKIEEIKKKMYNKVIK